MNHSCPLLMVLLLSVCSTVSAQQLTYRGFERLPEDRATGLSGITYAGDGTYWGVLERESKLLRLRIETRDDASIVSANIDRAIQMRKGVDYEGIAFSPAHPETVIVCTEPPSLIEVSLNNGRALREIALPVVFEQIVANQGLESVTCSADGLTLWTANERALKIDGNPLVAVMPFLSATRVRLLRYERNGDALEPTGQFDYQTGGVHGAAGQIGLCDLAILPDGRLLSLERSAAQGFSGKRSIRTRIYLVDPTEATDISGPPYDAGLVNQVPQRARKTLLYDGFVCDADGENLEGLCIGPALSRGRFVILAVVDNTDGSVGVSNPAVVSFELDLTAGPATQPATIQSQNDDAARLQN